MKCAECEQPIQVGQDWIIAVAKHGFGAYHEACWQARLEGPPRRCRILKKAGAA